MPRYLWLLLLTACGSADTTDLLSASGADAGSARDAQTPRDAGNARDAGSDDTLLGRALACHLTEEAQVEAAVRVIACSDPDLRATVVSYIEAFDSGLLGSFEPYLEGLTGFPLRQGCEFWRCAAVADSCDSLAACVPAPLAGVCREEDRFRARCVGDKLARCEADEVRLVVDCADFGAACIDGQCERDGCRFGDFADGGVERLSCSDDGERLVVCDGVFDMKCDAFRPGSSCADFYVSGEIPVSWCSPTGEGVAGAYDTPGVCGHGSFLFYPATRGGGEFSCSMNDYRGCNERGCRP